MQRNVIAGAVVLLLVAVGVWFATGFSSDEPAASQSATVEEAVDETVDVVDGTVTDNDSDATDVENDVEDGETAEEPTESETTEIE